MQNVMWYGRDEGRGVEQSKWKGGLMSTPFQPLQPQNKRTTRVAIYSPWVASLACSPYATPHTLTLILAPTL